MICWAVTASDCQPVPTTFTVAPAASGAPPTAVKPFITIGTAEYPLPALSVKPYDVAAIAVPVTVTLPGAVLLIAAKVPVKLLLGPVPTTCAYRPLAGLAPT